MSRYIDADKLIKFTNNSKDKTIDANDIARFPTADVVEVVMCKDCKYSLFLDGTECDSINPYYYCAWGERRDI